MHWLPLVAMVIASALPFPHNPVSRIAAATTEPGTDNRRERRYDQIAGLAAPPLDYNFLRNASQMDYNMAAALSQHTNGQNLHIRKDYKPTSVDEETSTHKLDNPVTYQSESFSSSDVPTRGTLRTEDISEDNALLMDYKDGRSSRQEDSSLVGFPKLDKIKNSRERRLQSSAADPHNAVSPAADPEGQRGPEPAAPSDSPRTRTGIQWTPGTGGGSLSEPGPGLHGFGDQMLLDTHPRVLFSPSPSPPEHPPLLLMLETGLLEEDKEEQDYMDGHIEGHGDRAIDRSVGWTDSSTVAEAARVVKRNKRSHLIDRRRGEKSVCESESVWVTDKKTAIDSHGQKVTILQDIQTQTGPLKQYFYETRCRQAEQWSNASRSRGGTAVLRPVGTGVAGAGCLGVDRKQWVSECKVKQSFVRALTKDVNNRTGWRWIRIDSSCVCVLLSRANQVVGREVLTRGGRG